MIKYKFIKYFYSLGLLTGICSGSLNAEVIIVTQSDASFAADGIAQNGYTVDGIFDEMLGLGFIYAYKYEDLSLGRQAEYRGIYKYILPPVLQDPNIIITSAVLHTPVISTISNGANLRLYGFPDNNSLSLSDFTRNFNQLVTVPISSFNGQFDVTDFIVAERILVDPSVNYLSFLLDVNAWGAKVEMSDISELVINYTVPATVNTPPVVTIASPISNGNYYAHVDVNLSATATDAEDGNVTSSISWSEPGGWLPTGMGANFYAVFAAGTHTLTATATDGAGVNGVSSISFTVNPNDAPTASVLSPSQGVQVTEGDLVSLQGMASDIQDGDLSASINWVSNRNGLLGVGPSISTSSLITGVHTVGFTVTDSVGARSSAYISLEVLPVQNETPVITINAPVNGTSVIQGSAITFRASAIDVEDGDLSNSISWVSSIDGVIGSGATLTRSLSAGSHIITANSQDSKGANGSASVTVSVLPSGYCDSKGNNTNYEWIGSLTVAGITNNSGKNLGYADFSSTHIIDIAQGSNAISLTPGFNTSIYTERWRVWVDLNQDYIFSADELLLNASGTTTINSSLSIPAAAMTGQTRMRISMKYGSVPAACGVFTYGEVEDYTINILP